MVAGEGFGHVDEEGVVGLLPRYVAVVADQGDGADARLPVVIDHLLATPVPSGPIVLVRPNVLYEFADPDLEALSSGQKLMLRMGPNNSATLKRLLEQLRSRLTAERPY